MDEKSTVMVIGNKLNQTHVEFSPQSRGFTLVEALVATVVLLLVAGATVTILFQSQKSYTSQHELIEASEAARNVMNQVQSFLRQAGNDPQGIGFVPISIASNQIIIRSDVTGDVGDGLTATGGPDGSINDRYEQVTISYNPTDRQLFIDVGSGPEVLADNIANFVLSYFDLQGNVSTDGNQIARVHIKVVAETGSADLQTGNVRAVTLESDAMVRSQSFQMFE